MLKKIWQIKRKRSRKNNGEFKKNKKVIKLFFLYFNGDLKI